ncbi:uncharacterized protein LOC129718738 [Wyeomyia smithii]|uniref:uncharacterized protein LOC129718738 n=1 Tax=Wyeomyia smithii TaxID=174621 RepID=UPI0024680F15|nr:uncharacterized protein LOC129718738 [Wyeomyia smithii]
MSSTPASERLHSRDSLSKEALAAIKKVFKREQGGPSKCRICGNQLKVDKFSNLKRHMQNLHQREYAEILVASGSNIEEMKIASFAPVTFDQNFLAECCVKMVTVGGLPFGVLERPGIADLLGFRIQRQTVLHSISLTVEAFREKIIDELKGQIICVKLDTVTRAGQSVVTVFSQLLRAGKFEMRTLAAYDLDFATPAEEMKAKVIETLGDFGVDASQIYAITTDNGINYPIATQLVYNAKRDALLSVDNGISFDDEDVGFSGETDQLEAGDYLEGNTKEEDALSVITHAIDEGVICAANAFHCCAHDAIRSLKLKKQLDEIRIVVNYLRTEELRKLFVRNHLSIPKLEPEIRWNSVFSMLSQLIDQKLFINELMDENDEPMLTAEHWTFIEKFVEAFDPFHSVTHTLQEEIMTMGDFYLLWLECLLRIEELANNYIAKALIAALNSKQEHLFESRFFLAALYFDPRINYGGSELLSEEHKCIAIDQILKLWEKIRHTESIEVSAHAENGSSNSCSTNFRLVEAMLRKKHSLKDLGRSAVEKKLKELALQPRISAESNVLVHWEQRRNSEPELYKLAQIVLSVPCTQNTAERAFSALGFVLSNRRLKLSKMTLSDMVFVKLNHDLFQQVEIDYMKSRSNYTP